MQRLTPKVWCDVPHPSPHRIAFMHIPTTAGVSVNASFVERLGPEKCTLFSDVISDSTFKNQTFVSGHVYLGNITQNAFVFTFLRDPFKQIASSLMWVEHLNMPDYEHELSNVTRSIRLAVQEIAKTDLADAASIDRYLQWLTTTTARVARQP